MLDRPTEVAIAEANALCPPADERDPRAFRALSEAACVLMDEQGIARSAFPGLALLERVVAEAMLSQAGLYFPSRDRPDDPLRAIPAPVFMQRLAGAPVCPKCGQADDLRPYAGGYWACADCQTGGTIFDYAAALWKHPTRGIGFIELRQRIAAALLERAPA